MTLPSVVEQLDLIELAFRQTGRWEDASPMWVYLARLRRFVIDLDEAGINFNGTTPPRTLCDMAKRLEWLGREIGEQEIPETMKGRVTVARRDAYELSSAIRRIEIMKHGMKKKYSAIRILGRATR